MRSVRSLSHNTGTEVAIVLTRRLLLKVFLDSGKVDQTGSIQLYECLLKIFNSTSGCDVITQVNLLERGMTRDTASDCFGAFHSEGKFIDIAYGKLVWL